MFFLSEAFLQLGSVRPYVRNLDIISIPITVSYKLEGVATLLLSPVSTYVHLKYPDLKKNLTTFFV